MRQQDEISCFARCDNDVQSTKQRGAFDYDIRRPGIHKRRLAGLYLVFVRGQQYVLCQRVLKHLELADVDVFDGGGL